jgi:hypothetical protein
MEHAPWAKGDQGRPRVCDSAAGNTSNWEHALRRGLLDLKDKGRQVDSLAVKKIMSGLNRILP